MTLLARFAVVVVTLVCAEASKNVTAKTFVSTGGTAAPSGQYFGSCDWGKSDLRWETSLLFSRSDTKCVASPLCSNSGAKMTWASCTNTDLGASIPTWSCRTTFAGSYSASNLTVYCPGYTISDPCVYTSQCEIHYTPQQGAQGVYVYSGVGGTLGFIFFCALIYWCCRRRNTHTTTTTIIRNVPAPESRPVSPTHTNVTVNMPAPTTTYAAPAYAVPAYPAPAYVAPAPVYAAPAPAYAPPPQPAYNVNY